MFNHPIDSTDAREQRELEQALAESYAEERRRHDAECVGGFRGETEDGQPIACPLCKPWVYAIPCRTCSVPAKPCENQMSRGRGPCCDRCWHARWPS